MEATEGVLSADGPNSGSATARAALDWWSLAGVDTLVAALPRSWLDVAPAGEPHVQAPAVARRPAAPARPPAGEEDFTRFDTLEAFHAHVRGRWPGAPLFDGVAGTGILVIGEAPSAADLETGRPFTGPAGKLLDRMLAAIGLDRGGCGITLLAPRRAAPGPPPQEDIARDLPLTQAHLKLLAPRAILLLGATATHVLTGETAPISALRGRPFSVPAGDRAVPALASFNPAYLLRRPEDKALAWADLLAFRAMLAEKAPA
jgi:DNA polymerase